ncbi:MAG: ectonucleotide pyrophosphatase/phosphodiesterase [Bacteroidales bacterium]|jgi:alkaline phosphatase D|nr:ectonucleotide pyrophosphatase/phosphodiesterase [Bacteroidales bacterium]
MKKLLVLTAVFFLVSIKGFCQEKQYVVVLSMDGFRWDYDQLVGTPNLDKIAKKGVKSKGLQPVFPTGTFPSHYSMATGLYPDEHGLVANRFFDKALQQEYSIRNNEAVGNPRFYGGEPIWNTARRQGLVTASYFWVGTEAPIGGLHPNIWKSFDNNVTFTQRIDSVISWLKRPEKDRPQLIMLYFEEPDYTAHGNDPVRSGETHRMVKYCDSLVGILDQKLQALPIAKNISLVVVSDHGMTPVDANRTVFLENYLKESWIQNSSWGSPMCLMDIYPEKLDSALMMLRYAPNVKAWRPENLPKRFNYGHNPNIGNLVILADSAWSLAKTPPGSRKRGDHGFDNQNRDMYGIFYAYGPKFEKNKVVPEFMNLQLYNIIAHLLNIRPAQTDAKLEDVNFLFNK